MFREVKDNEREQFNHVVTHIMQSSAWGNFRTATGLTVVRLGEFEGGKLVHGLQMTIHRIPRTPWTIGYIAKGPIPDKSALEALRETGRKHRCIFIQLEPDVIKHAGNDDLLHLRGLRKAARPLFTKYNFLLDLRPSEEELLKNMHSKTRYNTRLAARKGVIVETSHSREAFDRHLDLYLATTRRQKYFGHDAEYHQTLFDTIKNSSIKPYFVQGWTHDKKTLLASWMLLQFHNILYYPYGGSSPEHRELMASNLVAWEAMRLGKKLECTTLDMWGALGPDASESDPWHGFHRFKQGFGGKLIEYVGSYDLVLKPTLYKSFVIANKIRWLLLRLRP